MVPIFFSHTPLISPLYDFQNTSFAFFYEKCGSDDFFLKKLVFANLPKTAKFDCPPRAKKWGGGKICLGF